MRTLRIDEMNWVDIKKAIKDDFKTVIIGVGSTEQHGLLLFTFYFYFFRRGHHGGGRQQKV